MEPVKELKTNRKANDMESKAMVLSEEIRNEERELDWLDSALEKATVELKSLEEAFDFGPKWESKEDYVSSIFHEREETAMRLGRLLEEFKLELANAGWLLTGRMVCKRETIQSDRSYFKAKVERLSSGQWRLTIKAHDCDDPAVWWVDDLDKAIHKESVARHCWNMRLAS